MVGDPNGDWSRFTKVSGWTVNLLAIGNAASANLNGLIPGGGTVSYDVINVVGDMRLSVDNKLIDPSCSGRPPGRQEHRQFSHCGIQMLRRASAGREGDVLVHDALRLGAGANSRRQHRSLPLRQKRGFGFCFLPKLNFLGNSNDAATKIGQHLNEDRTNASSKHQHSATNRLTDLELTALEFMVYNIGYNNKHPHAKSDKGIHLSHLLAH
jgi:hypothetical protein